MGQEGGGGGRMPAAAAATAKEPGFFGRHSNQFLYVPNLIGYLRVVLSFASFAVAMHHPGPTFVLYFLR